MAPVTYPAKRRRRGTAWKTTNPQSGFSTPLLLQSTTSRTKHNRRSPASDPEYDFPDNEESQRLPRGHRIFRSDKASLAGSSKSPSSSPSSSSSSNHKQQVATHRVSGGGTTTNHSSKASAPESSSRSVDWQTHQQALHKLAALEARLAQLAPQNPTPEHQRGPDLLRDEPAHRDPCDARWTQAVEPATTTTTTGPGGGTKAEAMATKATNQEASTALCGSTEELQQTIRQLECGSTEELQQTIRQLEERLAASEHQTTQLQSTLAQLRQESKQAQEGLQTTVERLQSQLATKNEKVQHLEQVIEESTRHAKQLKALLKQLTARAGATKDEASRKRQADAEQELASHASSGQVTHKASGRKSRRRCVH